MRNSPPQEQSHYDNHFGNLPTHCPQWIRMGITRRAETAKQADYCTQCFDPDVFMTDVNHTQHQCKVTKTTKNKFSCLSITCLEHSWTCEDHREENTPLLAAHLEELTTLYPSLMTPVQRKHKPKDPDLPLLYFYSIPGRYRAANVFF